ncbi:hypothetical protein ACP70R_024238 [Stipagrostis hirtigluma subsp. patula]
MSGRPCVGKHDSFCTTLWLLTVDRRWEERWVVRKESLSDDDLDRCSLAGVWDCGGVLVLYLHCAGGGNHRLYLCRDGTKKKMFKADLPRYVTPEGCVGVTSRRSCRRGASPASLAEKRRGVETARPT